MALPKTRTVGKKRYGLKQTTKSKRVGKKAVTSLRKKHTPARLVKSTETRYGVYAGSRKPKAPRKARKTQAKTHTKRQGTKRAKRGDVEFMPANLMPDIFE